MECLFCRIAAGEVPAYVVAEDDQAMAFLDLRMAARGHSLVIPKRHVEHLWDSDAETAAAVMRLAHRVAGLIHDRLSPDGLTLRQNTGEASGQVIPHLHFHLVPRWHGDGHIGWPTRPEVDYDPLEVLALLGTGAAPGSRPRL
ncbi:MAG: hydrolase [Frankiales bacterium]|nr:hydrolase [Frankiales bacterium]